MFNLKSHIKAKSVDEAISLLGQNRNTRLIAGGTDVLIKLRHGNQSFADLVDINGLKELKFIKKDENENILIGSGVVFNDIVESDIIAACVPILQDAASSVGGPQIRNMATIGGNICNGVTSADSASGLFALNALLQLKSADGIREVPIKDFYLGPGKVDLKPAEMLTAIKITPDNYKGFWGYYYKYAMRNAMDIATIGCAVNLKLNNKKIQDYRIAYGVAGPVPMRCPSAEAFAKTKQISDSLLKQLADNIEKDVNPRTSWRASREFRVHIIKELAVRVTREALKRTGLVFDF
jgi:xanthine dehydrogenase FAD-binding subunit